MNTLPCPDDLADAPELAVLALLGTGLEIATAALVAAWPELHSPKQHLLAPARPGPCTHVWTIITLIRVLADEIELYRRLRVEITDEVERPLDF
jgi:hypothetical protein